MSVCPALCSFSTFLYAVESKGVWQEFFQMEDDKEEVAERAFPNEMEAVEVAEWDLHRSFLFSVEKGNLIYYKFLYFAHTRIKK